MKRVVITGGSGFVGQLLQDGLARQGWRVDVFDTLRSPLVRLLRRRHGGASTAPGPLRAAQIIRGAAKRLEPALLRAGLLRRSGDDILDIRDRLVQRFRGSAAVIHLAGIAHPHAPGTIPDDFRRINYDGSVNVFEAARAAGVPRFVFASSAQVYKINAPVRIDQFPILETNHCPTLAEGNSAYGVLKREFEQYLLAHCRAGEIQGLALRLECPGIRTCSPNNLYIRTSRENLVAGVRAALEAPVAFAADVFNLADAEVDPSVDIQEYLRARWPEVPNHTAGNQCLLSTEKAQRVLGYRPAPGGTYVDCTVVW